MISTAEVDSHKFRFKTWEGTRFSVQALEDCVKRYTACILENLCSEFSYGFSKRSQDSVCLFVYFLFLFLISEQPGGAW